MEEYIKKSDFINICNKALDELEDFLIKNEKAKARIGYETGYKDGIRDTSYALRANIYNVREELDNVQR